LIICGKKAEVVKVAASNPTISIGMNKGNVLYISLCYWINVSGVAILDFRFWAWGMGPKGHGKIRLII